MKVNTIRTIEFIRTLRFYLGVDFSLEVWLSTETHDELDNLFTPALFQNAINYESFLSHQVFNAASYQIQEDGERALGIYQARYVIEHLPKETIRKFFEQADIPDFDKEKGAKSRKSLDIALAAGEGLYSSLSEALGEPLREKFTHLEPVKVTALMLKNPDLLFRYPARLELNKNAIVSMNQKILSNQITCRVGDFYLSTFRSYKKVILLLPVLEFIIKNVRDDHLLWTAGDYLNIIWKILPADDEFLQNRFEKMIYELYWSKINSFWPIANYTKIKFVDESDARIFDDALGWIMSLSTITSLNPDFKNYFDFLADFSEEEIIKAGIPSPVYRRAFYYKYQDKSPREYYCIALQSFPELEALDLLSRPDDVAEAKVIVDSILNGEITLDKIPFIVERLLINDDPPSVGAYIIKRFTEELDYLESQLEATCSSEKSSRNAIVSMFTAACDSVNAPEELAALERFGAAIRALPVSAKHRAENDHIMDLAYQNAKTSVSDFQQARKKLIEILAY